MPLSPKFRLIITYIIPIGRFCFNKLLFGLTSGPEHFQCHGGTTVRHPGGRDDFLIHGKSRVEHDESVKNLFSV